MAVLAGVAYDEAHGSGLRGLAREGDLELAFGDRDRRLGGAGTGDDTGRGGPEQRGAEGRSEEEGGGESHDCVYARATDSDCSKLPAASGSPRPSARPPPPRGSATDGAAPVLALHRRTDARRRIARRPKAEREREARDDRRARRGDHERGRGSRDRRP